MNYVYHASRKQGLTIIEPNISTHDKSWVYATKNREESLMHLGRGDDLIIQKGAINDQLYIAERFEGALEYAYGEQSGSVYTLEGASFYEGKTSYQLEVVSEDVCRVVSEEKIDNILDEILRAEEDRIIKIFRYPDLPKFVPLDKSDLVEQYRNSRESLVRRGRWESVISKIKEFHPELLEKISRENLSPLKRISILGDMATGKSTFADFLSKNIGVPVIHIDHLLFDKEGNKVSDDVLESKIESILKQDSWILEGNSFPVALSERVTRSDTVIFFDFNPWEVLGKVLWRDIKVLFGVKRTGDIKQEIIFFNIRYYIPYIFKRFPSRKYELREILKSIPNKTVFLVRSNKELKDLYLSFKNS